MSPGLVEVEANGLRFACLSQGDGPLVLLLHGFPDDAGSWLPLMARIAEAGCRAVAPYMRGYGATGQAPDRRYRLTDLGGDAAALVQALGAGPAVLVGHDWGAGAAYAAVALAPERFSHVVGMSVPPIATLLHNLPRCPAQLRRSAYMLSFNLPGAAARVARDDLRALDVLWARWCPGWVWPPERLQEVKATLSAAGSLEAALSYYHEVLRGALAHPLEGKQMLEVLLRPLAVPGLVLVGEEDGCMAPEVFEGAQLAFSAPAQLAVVPGAGHFLQMQAPERVWAHVRDIVLAHGAAGYKPGERPA